MWRYSWQENTARGFVPSERRSCLRILKNPLNITSTVTPAGERIVLHRMRQINMWRWWSGLRFHFLILEVPTHPSQLKVERSCVKPFHSLAVPEWFIHWLIISCYNPVSMWPERGGRQTRRWWWRVKTLRRGEEDTRSTILLQYKSDNTQRSLCDHSFFV